jgi:hypothetical protein
MAYQGIGTGITPNDGTGDDLLTGAVKINSNFEEIYAALGDGTNINFSENDLDERIQDTIGSAISVGIQTGITVTYDDVNNRIDFSNYHITTTSTNKTLTNLEYCTVTADGLTITLPSNPSVGNKVMIGVSGDYKNTTIARNNSNIMSLAEDMVVDSGYVTLSMIYINSTLGWRIS